MPTLRPDVAILGAGSAGMAAWRAASAHTQNLLLIEAERYGTTCARVGCMPSKLLIAAAEAAHAVAHASVFGVRAAGVQIDGAAVMARVRAERDRFTQGVVDAVQRWPPEQRLMGRARFTGPLALQVDTAEGPVAVQPGRIVIATGSRPAIPPGWREALGDRLIVNDDVFSWATLPTSVAVVGTGAIGLELAQALHRLGVRVRLFGRGGRLGPLTDPALQTQAQALFSHALPLVNEAHGLQPSRQGNTVLLRWQDAQGRAQEDRFDWLLAATGRQPNVDDMGLAHSGLPLDEAGVPQHNRLTGQVGEHPVFIAGDVADDRPLLHEAADDGRIAGDNAGRWPDVRAQARRAPLAIVFTDPQMALAGASHAELCRAGAPFAVGEVSFAHQGRSRVMARHAGLLRVYAAHADSRFLGAEMVSPAAEHIGHLLAWSVQRGDTVQQMLDAPYYHPVVEEGVRTALRELRHALRRGPVPVPGCLDCGPGG